VHKMASPRPRGSTDSIHLGVNGSSSNNGNSKRPTTGDNGALSDSASTNDDSASERPDIFGDLLRTVPGGNHSEEDSGVSFVFPPVPQQVTIQTNHQRQESQRVLARSPSPPRMSTDTLTHTLNHRVSLPLISSIFSLFLFQKRCLLSMIAAIRVLPVFRLLLLHCPDRK